MYRPYADEDSIPFQLLGDEYDDLPPKEEEEDLYFDLPIELRTPRGETRIMSKEIQMTQKEEKSPLQTIEETRDLCERLMQTPHYMKMGKEGIFAIAQKAKSVGVDPLDALNGGMYYVTGKVEMSSALMNDLIRRHGHSITKDEKSNDEICILKGKRKDNGDEWTESFSIADAKLAGIYRNQWTKYPRDMLFARALSRLARQLFPDVIKGCYVEGEIAQAKERPTKQEKIENEAEVLRLEIEEKKGIIQKVYALLTENIDFEEPEFLQEYLEFCHERVPKPLLDVAYKWIQDPTPFLAHYKKWVKNKKLDTFSEKAYESEVTAG